jgi:UDP-galactopyranose mutase
VHLVAWSHLRWDFVYQRPQHILSRFARDGWDVTFVEEPIEGEPGLERTVPMPGVTVIRPRVPGTVTREERESLTRTLLDAHWRDAGVRDPVLWFYTPMALPLADGLRARAVVYDCMDELSAFAGADPALPGREAALLERATVVFTGGRSLYEAKRTQHANVHCFPSSVDTAHYITARVVEEDPPDQRTIPRPRLGFFGVIDERFDCALIDGMATACPGWSFVLVGPVVKIDPALLPRRPNIHYLGPRSYADLPSYIATWDVALIPFARNRATRYISPTKVLEYMAAGKPIVSTSIADVVTPYAEHQLVRIADRPSVAVAAARDAMMEDRRERWRIFDAFLARTSWDRTYAAMRTLVEEAALTVPLVESEDALELSAAAD